MPVRIADIPGLQGTQINAAPMSAKAAAAPAAALGNLAEGIASISKPFAQIAGQIQNTENLRQESEMRNTLDTELTNFRVELQKDPDPASRLKRMDEFLQSKKGIVDQPGLSPVVRDRMIPYFDTWATNTRNQNAFQAAELAQQRAAKAFKNEQLSAFENNDGARLKLAHDTAVAAGAALPEDWTAIEHDFNQKQRKDAALRDIYDDPAGFLEQNPEPPADGNPVEWENNRTLARQLLRQETVAANDSFQDMLAGGKITTPEQVDAIFGDQRPAVLASFKEDLARRGNAEYRAKVATPEYQAEVVGKVSTMLDGYRLDADGFDEKFVQMDSMVRSLPEGSAAKAELTKQLNRVRDGQEQQIEDSFTAARKETVEVFNARRRGSTRQEMSVQQAVSDGLLEDPEKLSAVGLPEDAVGRIIKGGLSDTQRAELFREELGKVPEDQRQLHRMPAIQRAAFEAIRDRKGFSSKIEVENPEVIARENRELGNILRQFDDWARTHPELINNEEAVDKKRYELLSPLGVKNFRSSLLPPVPTGVLPPVDQPEVPYILGTPPPSRR